jgi:hypothetical protein
LKLTSVLETVFISVSVSEALILLFIAWLIWRGGV